MKITDEIDKVIDGLMTSRYTTSQTLLCDLAWCHDCKEVIDSKGLITGKTLDCPKCHGKGEV